MTIAFENKKARNYFWAGALMLAMGLVSLVLNGVLDVPGYQKISPFAVVFWIVAGGCGMVLGLPAAHERGKRVVFSLAGMGILSVCFFGFGVGSGFGEKAYGYLIGGGGGLALLAVMKPSGENPFNKNSGFYKVIEYGEAFAVAIFLAIIIKGTTVQAFKIPSGSMLPTLQIGDQLLVTKFLYGMRLPYTDKRILSLREPERGDIVVFAYPGDGRSGNVPGNTREGVDFIKRIIGEPGDTVELREKKVFLNGQPLEDPWGVNADPAMHRKGVSPRDNLGPVKVPAGKYFVMGDNRDHSHDSRFWGFVDKGRIRGRAFILYWSWDGREFTPRWSRIGRTLE